MATSKSIRIDPEQCSQSEEPAFLDDEGPQEPPAHVSTLRLRDVLAKFSDEQLAAWPGLAAKEEAERRRTGQG